MKSFPYLLSFLLLVELSSCTEVIELDLNDSVPQPVIEATLSGADEVLTVRISESGSFTDPGEYPAITGAQVTLTRHDGTEEDVPEIQPGLYQLEQVTVVAGQTLVLSVSADEETYTASCQIAQPVVVDSVSFSPVENPRIGTGYFPTLHFLEDQPKPPFLRVHVRTSSVPVPQRVIPRENATDESGVALFQSVFSSGEMLNFEVQTMQEGTYRYFMTVSDLSGESLTPGSAAPANPPFQWSNGGLGYFHVYLPTSITAIVP